MEMELTRYNPLSKGLMGDYSGGVDSIILQTNVKFVKAKLMFWMSGLTLLLFTLALLHCLNMLICDQRFPLTLLWFPTMYQNQDASKSGVARHSYKHLRMSECIVFRLYLYLKG